MHIASAFNSILDDDDDGDDPVKECDLYGNQEPWDIWNSYGGNDLLTGEELFFFTRLKKLTPNGSRYNRRIASGVWQGEDGAKEVKALGGSEQILGFKKRFRYEDGNNSAQNGGWIMHEFTINASLLGQYSEKAMDYVLCRIKKNEKGQQQERADFGKKQRKSKQIGEKNESGQGALGRKRKLKQAAKPNNNNDEFIQNKRLRAEQGALLIQPTILPCRSIIKEDVESEPEPESCSITFDAEDLFSDLHQITEVGCIEYYDEECVQSENIRAEQEAILILPVELPWANNVLDIVDSEAQTQRFSNTVDAVNLVSNLYQTGEVDYTEYHVQEDKCVQNKYLMGEQEGEEEAVQVSEYKAETVPLLEFEPLVEALFSNVDQEFDRVFGSTDLELFEQWPL
ncbi:NAC domain-containing protein [Melia azedarach]|uniref:NAC domain-containing protein n=1 Tax=Melia azedarach TaxID=155640 RepID=A0ACC1X5K1_MELAZ|nr:NAC domain-containing protein [Melia azedarach]